MFGKDTYFKRREALQGKLQEGLILLLGNEEVGMNCRNNQYHFRQDSCFLYYVGLDFPSLTAIIDIDRNETILFGNEITLDDIIWTGPQPSLSEQAALSGITLVKPYAEVGDYLKKASESGQFIHFLPPYRDEHHLKLQQWLNLTVAESATRVSTALIKAIVAMRSYKTEEEIVQLDMAVDISNDMHRLFMRSLQAGVTEAEISGLLHGLALSSGGNISFPIIMTMNGEILHTHARNLAMKAGRLALCDSGAETSMHYIGDLTRAAPVSGTFSSQQKDIYHIVLKAQQKAFELSKPGVLYKDVHAAAAYSMLEGLKGLNLIKGSVDDAFANDAHTLFFPHGLGHMTGLDVHDMESLGEAFVGYTEELKKATAFGWKSLRLGRALEAGFTITVEPGLYFIPALIDQWKSSAHLADHINYQELEKYRDFGGIRIEDCLLITEGGNRVLGSKMAPKTVDEVEAYMSFNA